MHVNACMFVLQVCSSMLATTQNGGWVLQLREGGGKWQEKDAQFKKCPALWREHDFELRRTPRTLRTDFQDPIEEPDRDFERLEG